MHYGLQFLPQTSVGSQAGQFITEYDFEVNEQGHTTDLKLFTHHQPPAHRVIRPGVNLEFTCTNRECDIYQRRFWISQDDRKRSDKHCPVCRSKLRLKQLTAIGWTNARVHIDYQLAKTEDETFTSGYHAGPGYFQSLIVTERGLDEYTFFIIRVIRD